MSIRITHLSAAVAAAAALALSGCQAAAVDVSAETAEPVVLTMAHIDGGTGLDPAAEWFADRVVELSGGSVSVELELSCCGREADVEERLVDRVAAGEVDLGWVGTRVFGDLGVSELRALTAPMLLDSYALQREVLGSDAATDALTAVARLGVDPIALGPGAIRHPLATDAPLGAPATWEGVPVAAFHSTQNAEALALLGAEPLDVGFDERDAGLEDGTIRAVENSLAFVDGDREQLVPFATVDIPLWPRVSALIAAPGLSESVGDDVRALLRKAVVDVVQRTDELHVLDATAIRGACLLEATVASAGEGPVAELRAAFEPALELLRGDPATSPLIDEIERLKRAVPGDDPLPVPPDCGLR